MNVATVLTGLANEDPERPIVTSGGETIRRGELERMANRLARLYGELGVGRADRVLLALPNGLEHFAATHAIWKLGAIPVPTSPNLVEREFAELVAIADPRLIVGVPVADRASVPAGYRVEESFDDSPPPVPPPAPTWRVSTSGGSTGRPKLIVAAQSSDIEPRFAERLRLRREQVQLVCGPLYHSSPFAWATLGTCLGQHLIVQPRFSVDEAIADVYRHQVQWTCLVPTMMLRIWRSIDSGTPYDFSSIETLWHMAAPCPTWLKQRWIDLVGAAQILEAYAGTEGLAMTVIDGVDWLTHRGSVGRAVSGEIKIIGPDGSPAQPGQHGEVYMRATPGTATYQYIGAEATALDDGWETIGDLGHMDADGYLYLADRKTDMILVGGANIYPAEIEDAICEHPAVQSCAVVGLPDEDLGHRLHAVVQAEDGLDEATLRAFIGQLLTRTKHPRSFRFVDHPLQDDAGKLRRSQILAVELEHMSERAGRDQC